jgi:hypothetical protein
VNFGISTFRKGNSTVLGFGFWASPAFVMTFKVEINGRWIAEIPQIPGALA